MFKKLKTKYRYSLILLRELVRTDFKVKYQDSILGYLWSAFKPIFMFLILYVVFVKVMDVGRGVENWPVALFLGLTLFYFFADVAKGSLKSIVSHGGLLRKLKFPRYIIIISGSVSAMITLAINLCVVTIFALFMQVQFSWSMLIIIPVILEVYVFALGLGFFLSALYVKFRDIEFIWELVQQALFYGSMVLFPAKLILDSSGGVRLAEILLMNPLAQAVQDVRNLAISETIPSLWSIGGGWLYVIPIGIALLTFAFGVFYFRSKSPDFAEDV